MIPSAFWQVETSLGAYAVSVLWPLLDGKIARKTLVFVTDSEGRCVRGLVIDPDKW